MFYCICRLYYYAGFYYLRPYNILQRYRTTNSNQLLLPGVTTAATATTGTTGDAPDATPRAAVIGLPMMVGNNGTIRGGQQQPRHSRRHKGMRRREQMRLEPQGFFFLLIYRRCTPSKQKVPEYL